MLTKNDLKNLFLIILGNESTQVAAREELVNDVNDRLVKGNNLLRLVQWKTLFEEGSREQLSEFLRKELSTGQLISTYQTNHKKPKPALEEEISLADLGLESTMGNLSFTNDGEVYRLVDFTPTTLWENIFPASPFNFPVAK